MASMLKQIYRKLDDLDVKVSALLVKEEKATLEEVKAIQLGKKQFREGKFKAWDAVRSTV